MQLYYFLGIISYGLFLIQFLFSLFGGDLDTDTDIDVDTDIDTGLNWSDIFTFKGLIHMLMGISTYLIYKDKTTENFSPSTYDYLMAFILGLVFLFVLFVVVRFLITLSHHPQPKTDDQVIGQSATVEFKYTTDSVDGYFVYNILTDLNGCYSSIRAVSKNVYKPGTKVTILGKVDGVYLI